VVVGVTLYGFVLLVGIIGFSIIEHWNVLDSFYMTIISITTVGYGEINPLSSTGRVFTSLIIFAGLGTVFYTSTMLGRVILEGEIRGTIRRRNMRNRISKLRDHSIVCGFGRTGRIVAEALHQDGFPFCVVEIDRENQAALDEYGYLHLMGDSTEESMLVEAGIRHAGSVMALLSSDADNLYLTMMARELNPRVRIVARALDDMAERRLKRGGADHVVPTYQIAGLRVIQAAVRPTINEFIDLVTDREQLSLVLEEVKVEQGSPLAGQSLKEAGVRNNYGVIIVAIKKTDGDMVFNPVASTSLAEGDILIAMGEKSGLHKLATDCRQPIGS